MFWDGVMIGLLFLGLRMCFVVSIKRWVFVWVFLDNGMWMVIWFLLKLVL